MSFSLGEKVKELNDETCKRRCHKNIDEVANKCNGGSTALGGPAEVRFYQRWGLLKKELISGYGIEDLIVFDNFSHKTARMMFTKVSQPIFEELKEKLVEQLMEKSVKPYRVEKAMREYQSSLLGRHTHNTLIRKAVSSFRAKGYTVSDNAGTTLGAKPDIVILPAEQPEDLEFGHGAVIEAKLKADVHEVGSATGMLYVYQEIIPNAQKILLTPYQNKPHTNLLAFLSQHDTLWLGMQGSKFKSA